MRTILSCFVALLCCNARILATRPELDENWENFKVTYEKEYQDEGEESMRRDIWEANLDLIRQHNEEYEQGLHSYSLRENAFADMTHEEFLLEILPGSPEVLESTPAASAIYHGDTDLKDLPDSVDWREKNAVTPVKDQKQCGCCWLS